MKYLKSGNILSVTEGIIVHGCNARGVMGSGLAKQVKDLYPKAFLDYKEQLARNPNPLGSVIFSAVGDGLMIANAITQENYGRDSSKVYVDYEAISSTFQIIAGLAVAVEAHVHYPFIGAGLANGDWKKIDNIIDDIFDQYDVERTLWSYEMTAPSIEIDK